MASVHLEPLQTSLRSRMAVSRWRLSARGGGSLSAAERYVCASPANTALVDVEHANHSVPALNSTRVCSRKNVRKPQRLAVMSGFG